MKPVKHDKQSETENMGEIFVLSIQTNIDKAWLSQVKPMVMTEEDETDFDNATKCWVGTTMVNRAWNGMEWHGMAWNGMEWHGMAWNGMEWHGMAWN